jgi:hypothetical protein
MLSYRPHAKIGPPISSLPLSKQTARKRREILEGLLAAVMLRKDPLASHPANGGANRSGIARDKFGRGTIQFEQEQCPLDFT